MASRRTLKAAEAIREVVAMSILTDVKDPRVRGVTITQVDVSGDMRHAKVYFMILGGEGKERNALRGLQSAAGFFQSKVARRIDARYTPTLQFAVDEGVKNLMEISRILAEEKSQRETQGNSDESEDEFEDESDAGGESEQDESEEET